MIDAILQKGLEIARIFDRKRTLARHEALNIFPGNNKKFTLRMYLRAGLHGFRNISTVKG